MFNPPRSAGSALLLATVPCQGTARSGQSRGGATLPWFAHQGQCVRDGLANLNPRLRAVPSPMSGAPGSLRHS